MLWNLSQCINYNHKSPLCKWRGILRMLHSAQLQQPLPLLIPTSQQQPAEWATALHGFSAPSASRVGRIPNVMTTCHQSSSPKLLCTLCVSGFLTVEMSEVKHKTGENVHHCSRVHNRFPQPAAFLLGGEEECSFIYLFLKKNTPTQLSLLSLIIKNYCRRNGSEKH